MLEIFSNLVMVAGCSVVFSFIFSAVGVAIDNMGEQCVSMIDRRRTIHR
ncbi:MAG: hypothetical protein IIU02_10880 [Treponema sp.]|nr:hypothetical protein [Treponema sp.]MBQ5538389.1 hypothetical protein [Treponema sp.]